MSQAQTEGGLDIRQRQYRMAAVLLQKWTQEDPAYDERVGQALERELDQEPMKCEEPDDTPS